MTKFIIRQNPSSSSLFWTENLEIRLRLESQIPKEYNSSFESKLIASYSSSEKYLISEIVYSVSMLLSLLSKQKFSIDNWFPVLPPQQEIRLGRIGFKEIYFNGPLKDLIIFYRY